MATTTEIMDGLAPLLTADTTKRDLCIELAKEQYSDPSLWKSTGIYSQAMAYLALHMLALTDETSPLNQGGSGYAPGAINNIKEGDLQIGIDASGGLGVTAHVSLSDAEFASTKWGRMFIRLRNVQVKRNPRTVRV